MSRIFLSHSSRNNAQAIALCDWLSASGWGRDDIFLDIDATSGISPGERWQKALNDAAGRCEAVVFLISRQWLESRWCHEELALANKLNKRLFGILIDTVVLKDLPARLRDEWQLIDLESGRDGVRLDVELPNGQQGFATFSASGLGRLRAGLVKAGLDPRFFAWPPVNDPQRILSRASADGG
ncbi:TIR domain-containing protein [Mesorhizobium sp.]|uniref:toll/interleukin-1 receptor domain-containing protein n=1 Tax=Mesorhizobium sp. TaxID=1871066 RepID=UPI00257C9593|nr:TIR domain-containing protein [Mesorhizobium sp.]